MEQRFSKELQIVMLVSIRVNTWPHADTACVVWWIQVRGCTEWLFDLISNTLPGSERADVAFFLVPLFLFFIHFAWKYWVNDIFVKCFIISKYVKISLFYFILILVYHSQPEHKDRHTVEPNIFEDDTFTTWAIFKGTVAPSYCK